MTTSPFVDVPHTAAEHFKLYFYAAILRVLERTAQLLGARSTLLTQFPFLINYHNALAERGLAGRAYDEAAVWWRDEVLSWESATPDHLPLRDLRDSTGLDHDGVTLLIGLGLMEEDARFGALYAALHGRAEQHRPIIALLNGWWSDDTEHTRNHLRWLFDLGLIQAINPEAPRLEWAVQVPAPIWDAVRGDVHTALAPGLTYHALDQLLTLDQLIVPDQLRATLELLPALLESDEARALIVRGPQHNGRRTLIGAVARALGRGLITIEDAHALKDERATLIGSLAILRHALPLITLDLAPGETSALSRPIGYAGPIGLAVGQQGGLTGSAVERALTITLDMPDQAARHQHWQRGAAAFPIEDIEALSNRYRMTGGNVQRAAQIAQTYARLQGHAAMTVSDAQQATRVLNRQLLDSLAVRLETIGDWRDLAVGAETQRELHTLEARCRHREQLRGAVNAAFSAQLNCGVRALFTGPSGTGKTLAARLLAAALKMDLYRLDLSSVVNKYIGETEKNLNQVLSRAEELDVILLLDEGDALLTQRTSVHTSNDRYANLETNFLLQRLEAFDGILIVTTNAGERIDGAFQRRMDVVVDFRLPEAAERWAIWQLHLPAAHAIDQRVMQDVVARCALSGGQIRNAALQASLLALSNGGVIKSEYLEEAVQREYRKLGAVCPLRMKNY